MESHIRVIATVDEMKAAFNSDSDLFSIRHYSILIDDSQYTDKEWEKVKHQKFPFKVIVRHAEYKTYLNEKEMYSSWDAVVSSLKRKKLKIAEIKKELAVLAEKAKGIKETGLEAQKLDEQSKAKFEEFKAEDLKKVDNELMLMGDSDISEVAVIEDKIKYGNLTTEEYDELQELIKQAEAYANEVNVLAETDKIPGKIAKLEESIKYNESRRKELKKLIGAADEFAAKRAEILLNQLKMKHAAIKLYDVVKGTGEIKDTFKFTYDDKDYRWISTSEKIKAGLEVSNLLAALTGLVYPTYIDNAECITTNVDSLYGQVIFAFAKKTELNAFYPLRKKAQAAMPVKEAA